MFKADSHSFSQCIARCRRCRRRRRCRSVDCQVKKSIVERKSQRYIIVISWSLCIHIQKLECANANVLRSIFSLQWACTSSYVKLQNKPTAWRNEEKKLHTHREYQAMNQQQREWASNEMGSVLDLVVVVRTYKLDALRESAHWASWHNMIQRIPLCCVLHSFDSVDYMVVVVVVRLLLFFHFAISPNAFGNVNWREEKTITKSVQKKQDK